MRRANRYLDTDGAALDQIANSRFSKIVYTQGLPALGVVIEVTRGHHPDHQLLALELVHPAVEQLLAYVGAAAVAHDQIDRRAERAGEVRRHPGVLAVGALVDAGEAVTQDDDGTIRILHEGRDPGGGAESLEAL